MHLGESPRVEGPAGLMAELHTHIPTVRDAVHGARLSDKLWRVMEAVAGWSGRAGGPEDVGRGRYRGLSRWGGSPPPSWGSTRRGLPASPSGCLCPADTSPCPRAGKAGHQHSPCAAAPRACLGASTGPLSGVPPFGNFPGPPRATLPQDRARVGGQLGRQGWCPWGQTLPSLGRCSL